MDVIFLLLSLVLVSLQTFATLSVRRSVSYAPEQKSAQIRLIWLVPLLGAALVLSIMHQEGELLPRRGGSSQGPQNRS